VIQAVVKLLDFGPLIRLPRMSRPQAVVGWTTFVLTLLLAPRIDLAVMIGIGLGVGVHLWREREVHLQTDYHNGELMFEPIGVLYFGSATVFDEALIRELAAHPDATRLTVDLRKIGRLDLTGAQALRSIALDARSAGLTVRITTGHAVQGSELLRRVIGEDSKLPGSDGGIEIDAGADPQ
ncbi:MAG: STAS domain-containing protein, partial [Gammaproteobacteria bacterium]|nr:STAS domain-containing protein [Gammaproteobacteria bacterium]